MSGLIKKNDAVEAMLQLERDDEEDYGASIPEGFDGARAVEALDKLPVVEPLTDAEQRIFIEAMWREKDVCRAVDKEFPDAKVNLTDVCREIVRKVKGALWE